MTAFSGVLLLSLAKRNPLKGRALRLTQLFVFQIDQSKTTQSPESHILTPFGGSVLRETIGVCDIPVNCELTVAKKLLVLFVETVSSGKFTAVLLTRFKWFQIDC